MKPRQIIYAFIRRVNMRAWFVLAFIIDKRYSSFIIWHIKCRNLWCMRRNSETLSVSITSRQEKWTRPNGAHERARWNALWVVCIKVAVMRAVTITYFTWYTLRVNRHLSIWIIMIMLSHEHDIWQILHGKMNIKKLLAMQLPFKRKSHSAWQKFRVRFCANWICLTHCKCSLTKWSIFCCCQFFIANPPTLEHALTAATTTTT